MHRLTHRLKIPKPSRDFVITDLKFIHFKTYSLNNLSRYKPSCPKYTKYAILQLKVYGSLNYALCKPHIEYYVTHEVKVHPRRGHEGLEREYRYSSSLSLTSALDGVGGQRHAPAALYPQETHGTHCIGGWVGQRTGLYGCGKSRHHRDSIAGPSSPYRVAILCELSRPSVTDTAILLQLIHQPTNTLNNIQYQIKYVEYGY